MLLLLKAHRLGAWEIFELVDSEFLLNLLDKRWLISLQAKVFIRIAVENPRRLHHIGLNALLKPHHNLLSHLFAKSLQIIHF